METELVQDIVIVGAGIAGVTTSLGLHRFFFHFLPNQTIFFFYLFFSIITFMFYFSKI